jgi:hypothetical protein
LYLFLVSANLTLRAAFSWLSSDLAYSSAD